jgi:hypothetical protein
MKRHGWQSRPGKNGKLAMKKPVKRKVAPDASLDPPPLVALLGRLRGLIEDARSHALRAVDVIQMHTCWEVGRHIVEFEQGGANRAEYGSRLLPQLAERLPGEFGKGFDERNLRNMRAFFTAFPIWNALRSELSWTHYRLLSRVEDSHAREWYMAEAAEQNRQRRAELERERRLLTERGAVPQETEN